MENYPVLIIVSHGFFRDKDFSTPTRLYPDKNEKTLPILRKQNSVPAPIKIGFFHRVQVELPSLMAINPSMEMV
nr:hypothetical protein Itr_chr10CG02390 [Ipomoea trifida]